MKNTVNTGLLNEHKTLNPIFKQTTEMLQYQIMSAPLLLMNSLPIRHLTFTIPTVEFHVKIIMFVIDTKLSLCSIGYFNLINPILRM